MSRTSPSQQPDRRRMRYLNELLRIESERGRDKSKRANWLKFCRRCGKEISGLPYRVTFCARCQNFTSPRGTSPT